MWKCPWANAAGVKSVAASGLVKVKCGIYTSRFFLSPSPSSSPVRNSKPDPIRNLPTPCCFGAFQHTPWVLLGTLLARHLATDRKLWCECLPASPYRSLYQHSSCILLELELWQVLCHTPCMPMPRPQTTAHPHHHGVRPCRFLVETAAQVSTLL